MSSIFGDLDVDATPDAPLGTMTWYGIGGHADLLLRPRSIDALATLVKRCSREGVPLRVLGSGANLLVADEGVDGLVVRLDAECFCAVQYNTRGQVDTMRAGAGADMARTLMDTVRRGLDGLTQMAGIPASIGGALVMNAGGAFGSIGDAVESVQCITRRGEIVTYPAGELRFEYRRTNIPDPVILGATFNLREDDPVVVRQRVKEIFAFKKSTQPLAEHSAGCAFKNVRDPVTDEMIPAGKLIDECGLKGERIGGASVSRHHANFIVTGAGANADDVLRLIDSVRERVLRMTGYELEPEVRIWKRGDPA